MTENPLVQLNRIAGAALGLVVAVAVTGPFQLRSLSPVSATSRSAFAAPRFIMVYGQPLREPVVLADWNENVQFMVAVRTAATGDHALLQARPSLQLALYWGPEWANYPATPHSLARLRPWQANQHGRFYPTHGTQPALLTLGAAWVKTVRTVADSGLSILARHGVPVRLD